MINHEFTELNELILLHSEFDKFGEFVVTKISVMNKKEIIKYGIQLLIAIFTAIGTTLGVSSCMSLL